MQQEVHGAGPTPDQVLLGGLVRAHRARLRLTQEELAERAGLSVRTLRNLEGGRIRRPYPDTTRRLADALQLTGRHRDQLEAAARGVALELAREETVPSLLPPSVTDFTGRQEEVASVLELLATDGLQEGPHTVVISALAGKPGIGKTTAAQGATTAAAAAGADVLWAACWQDDATAHAPWRSVLADLG